MQKKNKRSTGAGMPALSVTGTTVSLKLSLTASQYKFTGLYGQYAGKTKRQRFIRDLIDQKIKNSQLLKNNLAVGN